MGAAARHADGFPPPDAVRSRDGVQTFPVRVEFERIGALLAGDVPPEGEGSGAVDGRLEPCDLSVQQRTGAGSVHAVMARVRLAVPFAVAGRREEEFRVVEGLRQRRGRGGGEHIGHKPEGHRSMFIFERDMGEHRIMIETAGDVKSLTGEE